MKIRKNRWQLLGVSMLLSFLFLGLCSKSSPLYPMNIWPDVNCFFTVGKSLLHGMIPYRDLYEQKGPILYFLYALAAWISETSFAGAYILDAVSFGFFLFVCGLCTENHVNMPKGGVFAVLTLLAAILTTTEAVAHGGSAEQMFLWALIVPLYLVDRAICENRILKLREAFGIGLCAGVCLYVKFTFLGFFFGLALFVLVWYALFEKQPKALPAVIGSFLGGIAAVSVPVFLFFLFHGAVADFFTVYFYNNLFLYQKSEGSKLYFYLFYLFTSFRRNPLVALSVAAMAAWLLVTIRKQYKLLTAVILSALFLSIAVLAGGVFFIYYPMVFTVYTVYGLIALVLLVRRFAPKLPVWKPAVAAAANVLLVAVLLGYAFFASNNTYLLGTAREELPQYRFAEQIRQKENPTLLNFGFLDGGFYFAADVLPVNQYFATLNLILPEMEQEQAQMVEAGAVDFVVLQNQRLEDCNLDASRYSLLDTAQMYLEGNTYTYYLYERIN